MIDDNYNVLQEYQDFMTNENTSVEDIFHAHIGGADTFARALLIADKIITSSPYTALRKDRYSSFDSGKGKGGI